jgi:hypothetical protein
MLLPFMFLKGRMKDLLRSSIVNISSSSNHKQWLYFEYDTSVNTNVYQKAVLP